MFPQVEAMFVPKSSLEALNRGAESGVLAGRVLRCWSEGVNLGCCRTSFGRCPSLRLSRRTRVRTRSESRSHLLREVPFIEADTAAVGSLAAETVAPPSGGALH